MLKGVCLKLCVNRLVRGYHHKVLWENYISEKLEFCVFIFLLYVKIKKIIAMSIK